MEVLIPITLFICVAGVLILRPITKRLGLLLETVAQERRGRPAAPVEAHTEKLIAQLERLEGRVGLLEERLDFVERLGDTGERRRISGVAR